MTNNKFLIRLLPVLALSFFIVSCGGNADTAGDEAATDQTEHTHDDGHMHDGDHMEAGADVDKQGPEYTSAYICPMHCDGSGSDEPGECPVCGMDYVKNEDMPADGHNHDHNHDGHNH